MYTEFLQDITHNTPQNKPGVTAVRAVPKDSIAYMRSFAEILSITEPWAYPLDSYVARPFNIQWITLVAGASWLNISKDFACQLELVEKELPDVQLKKYEYQLLFDLPNDDYDTRGKIIQAFSRREWVLIVQLNSGAIRLIGSLARGADFSSSLQSGNAIKGPANKYTCGFTWATAPEPAFYIARP